MENIRGIEEIIDPFYRYRMPTMSIKYTKSETIIENIDSLAKSLDRSTLELLKMFSYCLGTNLNNNKKSLKGQYSFDQLYKHLITYIDTYILCSYCGNPETIYNVNKGKLNFVCKACSGKTCISNDSKLTKYIITQL